jgi:biopolymer transport protein TolQ
LSRWEDTIPAIASLLLSGRLETLLEQTGWVARTVLLILLLFSLFSWAIIFQKLGSFGRMEKQSKRFLETFRSSRSLPEPSTLKVAMQGSPLVRVYDAGYRELQAQLSAGSQGINPNVRQIKNPHAVGVEMQITSAEEVRQMEQLMPWLATTASVTPFIGLFGTVWGVMDAFAGLGEAGSATLRAVAPGIAEALVTTAAGLFTAVPAVVFYNLILHRIRDFAGRMDSFAMEFVAMIETMYG